MLNVTKMNLKLKKNGSISSFMLFFLIFGFPIQLFLPFILNIDSSPINIGFRIFFLVISIFITLLYSLNKTDYKTNIGWFFFILFWFLYSIRLIYDIQFKGLNYLETDSFYVYSFAFGTCLIPSIAIYFSANYIDLKRSILVAFLIILISNLVISYSILSVGEWNILNIIIKRATISIEIEGVSVSILNPITIGYLGEVLIISSLHILIFNLISLNKYFRVLLYLCLFLGVLNLTFGASRGPILSLLFLLMIEIYFAVKRNKFSYSFFIKTFSFFFILIILMGLYIFPKIDTEDIALIDRFTLNSDTSSGNESISERSLLFESAWSQFLDSPIWGYSFVTKYPYRSYSHNIFMDVLMGTGIIGMIIFSLMGYYIFKNIKILLKSKAFYDTASFLCILYISILLICMTSGGLFVSGNFWIFSSFILGLNKYENS